MAIARKPAAKSATKSAPQATAKSVPEATVKSATKSAPAVAAQPAASAGLPSALDQSAVVLPALEETLDATLTQAETLQEQVRLATEKSVEQTKLIYERLKAAADETSSSLEASLTTASKGVSEINLKTLDALRANSDAQFAFFKALLATQSLSEALALQGEHARLQIETMHAQAKDLSALIQQVSTDAIEPIKTSLTRSMQIAA